MDSGSRKVFVLGAGFTRAFLPDAPLMTDDYEGESLVKTFEKFSHALKLLELERKRDPSGAGRINIERLMTRLDGRMPHDFEQAADEELGLLLSEIKKVFIRQLEKAKAGPIHGDRLRDFARYCTANKVTCITFNYDDILDEALWAVEQGNDWHPDMGYGFFCQPSEVCMGTGSFFNLRTSMHLLKLHGSVNWRIKRGSSRPYAVNAVVHHEKWYPGFSSNLAYKESDLILHLESEPFIVPPVLMKSAIMEQPILRVSWTLAYQTLVNADEVVFIGYSLPVTDIAAGFLFGETLKSDQVRVVNTDSQAIEAYRQVFKDIKTGQFECKDALKWATEILSRDT